MKIDLTTFRQRYALPMGAKVLWTQSRVKDFYDHFNGNVFLSFSGGKDSQVLAEIIKEMGLDIELVFFDTHNENPAVYDVVRRYGATVVQSPLIPWQVIDKVGYPLFNKSVANIINDIQRGVPYTSKPKPNSTTEKMLKEIKERYADFINSPLRINDKCCDELKKKPSHEFTKRTGKHPIIATLAVESQPRMGAYLRRGCNSFTGKNIKSTPLGIWSKKNILEFIASRNLQIADCYRAEISNGICKLHGCAQTGCMFCGFGKGMDFAYKILKAKFPAYYATLQQKAVGK